MGAKKETVKKVVKKGGELGVFQKLYKHFLKLYSPAKAKKAAQEAYDKQKKIIVDKKIAELPEKIKKVKKGAIIGGGGLGVVDVGGYALTGESPILGPALEKVKELKKLFKAKGGYVRKMKAGGSVSRGTGAAIKGTKFKGVF